MHQPISVGVFAESPLLEHPSAILATELGLPLASAANDTAGCTHGLCLTLDRLELRELTRGGSGPIYADFVLGQAAHRRRFGGGRGQPLARAVGLKANTVPTVIDATAGLGRDAFVLASLGCTVYLLERSPIIAALLRDGLARAARDQEIGPWVRQRLHLIGADSRDYLPKLSAEQRPDVVYLDPMYPHRQKTALVKKEMRLLRALVGDDQDASSLLATALACARRRAVVKRPRWAPTLSGPTPDFQTSAPNTRFDIYLTKPSSGNARV